MKTTKIILMIIIFVGIVISFKEYREYHKKEIVNECIDTKEEEMIVSCIENPALIKYPHHPNTIQNAYDFAYSHKDFSFKDKSIQYIFVFNYAMNFSDCKGTKECNLHDGGKGYYLALNNCLMNEGCTDIVIDKDSNNCLLDFKNSLSKLSIDFKQLIKIKENDFCKIHKNLEKKDIK